MTATKTQETYCLLQVSDVIPTKDNPRIINTKSDSFLELVDSVRARGVMVPIHVRDHPEQKGKYQLLAGERRLLAAKQANVEEIRALNHGAIGDDEAFEITFIENYARADLTPLEQGKAVATLLGKYKGDTQAVASKMGRSVRWVLQRAAVEKNLSKEWKKAVVEDPACMDLTASHLQLIAAFPKDLQNEFFEDYHFYEYLPVKELEKKLADRLRLLTLAKFSVNDADLVKGVKACTACRKRTACQPGLFDDTADGDTIRKNDRCLNPNCWQQKTTAWLKKRFTELKAEHRKLICITTEKCGYSQELQLTKDFGKVVFAANWKASKEGTKDALPALQLDGDDAGSLRWVRFAQVRLGYGKTEKIPGKPTPLRDRRVMLKAKRAARFLVKLEEIVKTKTLEDVTATDGDRRATQVIALAIVFGVDEPYMFGNSARDHAWAKVAKLTSAKDAGRHVFEQLWVSVRTVLCRNLEYNGPITQTPASCVNAAETLANMVGVDIKTLKADIEAEIPEPRTWANLAADGTPKKVKPEKTAKKKSSPKKNGNANKTGDQ